MERTTKWIHSWDWCQIRKNPDEYERLEFLPNGTIVHDLAYVMVDDNMPRGAGFLPESDDRTKACMEKRQQRLARERAYAEDRLRYELSQRNFI